MSLALDEPSDSDSVFTNDGTQYIIEKDLLTKIGTVTIDYVNEGWQKGFTINAENPVGEACSIGGSCAATGSCSHH